LLAAENIVTFIADLALLFIVAEINEAICENSIAPSRAAVQAELNEFDATFDEEYGDDPLGVLAPREDGEIPRLPLESRAPIYMQIAYKKGSDGRRGEPVGLFMSGDPSLEVYFGVMKTLRWCKGIIGVDRKNWSSSLNCNWTTKSFEYDPPANFC
jgi:hypothetical protein